jgi:sugar lactone lactonase YvrE
MRDPKVITGAFALLVAAVAVAGAAASSSAPSAGSPYKVVGTFGKDGSGNGQTSGPKGIAVASNGNVYVADANNYRVEVFSASGAYKSKWGSSGTDTGHFNVPRDVDLAPDGTVWVADDVNARAQQFSASGAYKSSLDVPNEAARGIAVDAKGNVLVGAEGEGRSGVRVFTGGTGSSGPLLAAGAYAIQDVESSPDGTMFITANDSNTAKYTVRHFTADGKPLGSFVIPNGGGIGVDMDCNVWATDFPGRAITKYSPGGKKLATAASPDLQANDIAIAKNGDLYVTAQPGSVVHFAENKASPRTAGVPARISVKNGSAKIPYAAGFSCPGQVSAVATLSGGGVSGKSVVQIAAGKVTPITMKVRAPAGKTKATFKIVLKTNGRKTTETKSVTVAG